MLLTILRRWSRCFSDSLGVSGLYYGALHVLKSSRALCPCVSSFLSALWSPRLGKRDLVCVLLVHLVVCFVRVSFCHFSLPLGVGGWLRFVIVALPFFYVEANAKNNSAKFRLNSPYSFWGVKCFNIFRKISFRLPWRPIELSGLENYMRLV